MSLLVHCAKLIIIPIMRNGVAKLASKMTISERLTASTDFRIAPDLSNPNTTNYPTLEQFLILEAANGYKLLTLKNNLLITCFSGESMSFSDGFDSGFGD